MGYKREHDRFLKAMTTLDEIDAQRRRDFEERQRFVEGLFEPLWFHENPKDEIEWLIDGLLPRGYLAILAGDPKEGKTSLATAMALAVATGTPFAGRKTTQSAVLWLSLEESRDERGQIMTYASAELRSVATDYPIAWTVAGELMQGVENHGIRAEHPLYTTFQHLAIDTSEGLEALDWWVARTRAALIVIDPLHAAHSGRSLTDGWGARKTLQLLKDFCTRKRVTALVLHHLGTRGRKRRVAESAQLSATASMFMLLERDPEPNPEPHSSVSRREVYGGAARGTETEEGGWGVELSAREGREAEASVLMLECKGRGRFANQTYTFRSEHPLHYEEIEANPNESEQTRTNPHKLNRTQQAILAAIANGPKTTKEIKTGIPEKSEKTIRNTLTTMCAFELIDHRYIDGQHRYFPKNPCD